MLICEFWRLVADGLAWVTPFFSLFFGGGEGGGVFVGSMIRGRHGWWSLAWKGLLASLLV